MTDVEAMQLITGVCAGTQGNLKDHQLIQEALNIIRNKAFPIPVQEPETLKPDFKKNKTETEDSK